MITCSKCKESKPDDNYATYWHSTQQATRRRKVCNPCFNEQKRIYRESIKNKKITQPDPPELIPEPIIDYSNNPDYRECSKCKEWKHVDEYYKFKGKAKAKKCKKCYREDERELAEKTREENGGGNVVPLNPNVYSDKYQKQTTFDVMQALGYIYDNETGIWFKPGIKEIVDGLPFFTKLKPFKKGKYQTRVPEEKRQEVITLSKSGVSLRRISSKLGISDTTIWKIIKENERN